MITIICNDFITIMMITIDNTIIINDCGCVPLKRFCTWLRIPLCKCLASRIYISTPLPHKTGDVFITHCLGCSRKYVGKNQTWRITPRRVHIFTNWISHWLRI